jgi:cell division protein FtsI/penicillin-binding protein 2
MRPAAGAAAGHPLDAAIPAELPEPRTGTAQDAAAGLGVTSPRAAPSAPPPDLLEPSPGLADQHVKPLPRSPVRPPRSMLASLTLKRAVALASSLTVLLLVLVSARSPEPSAEPTVQQFLLAWEQGQYRLAASLTTGDPDQVTAELRTAYRQLDAANLVLGMHRVSQHNGIGHAQFNASIDLGRSGAPWEYRGQFTLRMIGSDWKVVWSPSVIYPGLRPGYRLAVVTTMPKRAALLDAAGKPLTKRTLVYVAGVRPGKLKDQARTADRLARATGLDANEVYGDIIAAPSARFFELARLRPSEYRRLAGKLGRVPGLIIKRDRMRLFDSAASSVAGSVGTETARVLRDDGVPYRPGTTVGLSGLQLAYQRSLVGTPTTEVVAENAAGRQVSVLRSWHGSAGKPVRTTIDAATQAAANRAVGTLRGSGAIVAVRASDGKILAVATHKAHGMPAVSALNGHYQPGQAFTIVSTAALVAAGFDVATPIPCMNRNRVGGRTFRNIPPESALGPQPPFQKDFARACGTAFAGLSLRLHPSDLTSAAAKFGFGAAWRLPLRAFAGSIADPADVGQLAADSIGEGTVRASPLDMALVAAAVQSGTWHQPTLVTNPAEPALPSPGSFSPQVVGTLRSLMRQTVTSGDAVAAAVRGGAVYGQVGNVSLGRHRHGLRACWFVGYRGNVAFAVLELTRSARASMAPVAGTFLRDLPASS